MIYILTLLITLPITLVFTTSSYAEWMKVATNVKGDTYYVDFKTIEKQDGYVYFWNLSDYLKLFSCFESDLGQDKDEETLSTKARYKGDCRRSRYKILNYSWYKEPMGKGTGISDNIPDSNWTYPSTNSSAEIILKSVCNYAK
jgi:hypothetical protein